MAKDSVNEMSFLDHLEELRWHIIKAIGAVVLFAFIAFLIKGFIFDVIIFGPKQMSFPTYKWLCKVSQFINIDTTFCGSEFPFVIQNRTMAGQFSAHIWTSIAAGFILAFPYVIYQIWSFISPGLHSSERRYSKGFIFSFTFYIGIDGSITYSKDSIIRLGRSKLLEYEKKDSTGLLIETFSIYPDQVAS